jgi:hypothetical protein
MDIYLSFFRDIYALQMKIRVHYIRSKYSRTAVRSALFAIIESQLFIWSEYIYPSQMILRNLYQIE